MDFLLLITTFFFQIYSQSVSESDINYIINVCECYGRFILHKEASTTGCLEFSIQAEKLLNWTTLKIIPACRLSTTSMNTMVDEPFLDLNISSIAVEQSFVGYSPVVTGPPRRRTNLSRTPDKLGDASGIFNPRLSTNHERHHEGACVLGGSVAVALLQSSCVVFSEWLAVGGSSSETIAKAAVEWCHVFDSTESDNSIESELLPAFCRLALEVFMSGSDVSVLKAFLLKCKDPDSAGTIKRLISSLLSSKTAVHDTSIMTRIVECILSVAHDVRGAEFQSVTNIAEVPKTFAAMFEDKLTKSCTSSGLEAILESRLACIELAKLTIRNIKSGYEAEEHSIVMFNALCLQILCDGAHGNSKVVNDVTDMVRAIDFDAIIDKSTNVLHPSPGDDAGKILKAIKIAIDAK